MKASMFVHGKKVPWWRTREMRAKKGFMRLMGVYGKYKASDKNR